MAWCWIKGDDRYLIVVNLSDSDVQARVQVPWSDLRGKTWRLKDALSDASYDRNGDEMAGPGLYVELGPWRYNLFQCVTGNENAHGDRCGIVAGTFGRPRQVRENVRLQGFRQFTAAAGTSPTGSTACTPRE